MRSYGATTCFFIALMLLSACVNSLRIRAGEDEDATDQGTSGSTTSPSAGVGGGDSGAGGSSELVGSGGAGGGNTPQPMNKCGDGVVGATEECDDGNNVDGDGCSACIVDCESADVKHPGTNHCYHLVEFKAHWQAAASDCQVWGGAPGLGKLVSIQDQFEQELVQNLGGGNSRWIGATDVANEDNFAWSDGTPFAYENWRKGEPNNDGIDGGEEDCAEIEADGQWDDQPCEKTKYYVCERRAAGLP